VESRRFRSPMCAQRLQEPSLQASGKSGVLGSQFPFRRPATRLSPTRPDPRPGPDPSTGEKCRLKLVRFTGTDCDRKRGPDPKNSKPPGGVCAPAQTCRTGLFRSASLMTLRDEPCCPVLLCARGPNGEKKSQKKQNICRRWLSQMLWNRGGSWRHEADKRFENRR
jgi:hypothetical protein